MIDIRAPKTASLLVALGSVFALSSAWYFQVMVGFAPCELCLIQRVPYYIAVPVAFSATLLASRGYRRAPRAGLVLLAALMLVNMGIAVYHAGIEWHFWAGPTACTGVPTAPVGDIMSALKTARVPRCDEAPWRLFGISMAGWNALIALALAGIAGAGAIGPRTRDGSTVRA